MRLSWSNVKAADKPGAHRFMAVFLTPQVYNGTVVYLTGTKDLEGVLKHRCKPDQKVVGLRGLRAMNGMRSGDVVRLMLSVVESGKTTKGAVVHLLLTCLRDKTQSVTPHQKMSVHVGCIARYLGEDQTRGVLCFIHERASCANAYAVLTADGGGWAWEDADSFEYVREATESEIEYFNLTSNDDDPDDLTQRDKQERKASFKKLGKDLRDQVTQHSKKKNAGKIK
jgi:hypothetical protein